MKRKLLLLSVLAICVATLAAGTLAYFSANGTTRNVITTGNVSIAVEEWADADKTQPFEDLTGIMPGTPVTKIAEVRNTGEADAWIRVRLTGDIRLTGDGTPDPSLIKPDLNTTDWTLAADIDEAEREAQLFEVLDDDVHLVAHVLEHMQLADLRTDMQVDAYDIDMLERLDLLGMLKHLFI